MGSVTTFTRETTGEQIVAALPRSVEGKTILITGPSAGGLGAEAVTSLAAGNPAQIILVGRSQSKIDPVIAEIKAKNSNIKCEFVQADLTDNDSVRAAAKKITAPKIDILINNAGVMAIKDYTKSKDGFEMQLAANHIGHFLLTNLIMDKLVAAGNARVVNVTSMGYETEEFRFDDYNFQVGFA